MSDGTYLEIGQVITAFIALVLTGLVLFVIIKAYNKMKKAKRRGTRRPERGRSPHRDPRRAEEPLTR